MEAYYIALNPDHNFSNFINKQKDTIKNLIGPQLYLKDPPHITLFLFKTDNPTSILQEIKELSLALTKIKLSIKDLHVFYNDKWTGGNTITYNFHENDVDNLKQIQIQLINKVHKQIEPFFTEQYKNYNDYSELEKSNINKFGFPFVGENWIPHITLASIEKDKFDIIFEKIKQTTFPEELTINAINLYKVEGSELVKSFELKSQNIINH